MMSPINITHYQHANPAKVSVQVHRTAFTAVRQSRKRLRFQPTIRVQPIDCRMTQDEKSRSYYSREEMKSFNLEVRTILNSSKKMSESSTCDAPTSLKHCVIGLEADPSIRGLEQYLCPIRVRNKALVRKCLLRYQKKMKANLDRTDEEKLRSMASVSAKLSHWASHVAIKTARLDSLRASEDYYLIPVQEEPANVSPFPGAPIKRRTVSFDEDNQPSKRRRM